MKVHIIKEENGKKTELDTVINTPGGMESVDLENLMKDMHVRIKNAEGEMKEAEDQMKIFEIHDVPEPPDADEELENEFFNQNAPRVFTMPDKGESLSDVLGNIPMSRVKSYKIIDKKGGKRIIIDVQDGQDFGRNNVIYINGRHSHARTPRGTGHPKEMKVIIHSCDDEGATGKPGNAATPAEPKKSETNAPKI